MNWPNRLTILRILMVPVFIAMILYKQLGAAFIIFVLAAVTDCLDGYIARTFKARTSFGAMMDPIADKLLIGSAFISFSLVEGLPAYLNIPAYVPVIVISRDVIILTGVMCIYLASPDKRVEIKPTMLGKATTVIQMLTVIALLLRFIYSNWLWNITVVFTIVSGLDYIRIGSKYFNSKT